MRAVQHHGGARTAIWPPPARMLMAIANHPIISDRNHGSVLPSSWRTLYELARLPNAVLLAALADGIIHPKMERKDARALVDDGEDAGAVEQRMSRQMRLRP